MMKMMDGVALLQAGEAIEDDHPGEDEQKDVEEGESRANGEEDFPAQFHAVVRTS
jgi:hypothetical protein